MNSSAKLAVALVLGAAVGGAAAHQLHAQAKPPAFLIFGPRSETETPTSLTGRHRSLNS